MEICFLPRLVNLRFRGDSAVGTRNYSLIPYQLGPTQSLLPAWRVRKAYAVKERLCLMTVSGEEA